MNRQWCDTVIMGGGLAGLSCAILLARQGHRVLVLEKDDYPRHKVCGEYISLESEPFLRSIGVPVEELGLPRISRLVLTAPGGTSFETPLPLGGFGLSRYLLDRQLADSAVAAGVELRVHHLVEDFRQTAEGFTVQVRTPEGPIEVYTRTLAGSWGKRSAVDLRMNRPFTQEKGRLNSWVGIKYHVRSSWPADAIGLHNFRNGYCGISRIEAEKHCLCYLVRASELKPFRGNIGEMESAVLGRNPHLRSLLRESERLDGFPVTISQVSFSRKAAVEGGALMLGDTAGMITPLCGNGMSIALHSGKIAAQLLDRFLHGEIGQSQLENAYRTAWTAAFARRLRNGRWLQRCFGAETATNLFIRGIRTLPFLATPLIRMTHGKPF